MGNTEVDQYLRQLGTYKKFPMIMYFMVCMSEFPMAWQWLAGPWLAAKSPHHCRVPLAPGSALNNSIPYEKNKDGEQVLSQCKMFSNVTNSTGHTTLQKINCGYLKWEYDNEFGETIVSEWDLVCDKSSLAETISSVFFIGVLVGCLTVPALSDTFGRKKVMLVATSLSVPVSIGAACAQSYIVFVTLKFFTAVFMAGAFMCSYILICEFFPPENRSFAGEAIYIFWSFGYMSLSPIAYFVRNWRHLQLVITIPMIPLLISYIWLVPESLHWLIAKGKISSAQNILEEGARLNKVHITDLDLSKLNCIGTTSKQEKKYTLWDVLKTPYFRVHAVLMCFVWAVNALVYYGLSLGTSTLPGDRFIVFFTSGLVEIPARIVCILFLKWWGRRKPTCAFHLIAGISLLIIPFIPSYTESGEDLAWLQTTFAMIGKFGITASFGAIYLQTAELYPTVVRNTGLGFSSSCARVGGILAPYSIILAETSKYIQPILFGVLATAAAAVVMVFPETLSRPLPQTLDDVSGSWKGRVTSKKEAINSHVISDQSNHMTTNTSSVQCVTAV